MRRALYCDVMALGDYQTITTVAKQFGGPKQLLQHVAEQGANSRNKPMWAVVAVVAVGAVIVGALGRDLYTTATAVEEDASDSLAQ